DLLHAPDLFWHDPSRCGPPCRPPCLSCTLPSARATALIDLIFRQVRALERNLGGIVPHLFPHLRGRHRGERIGRGAAWLAHWPVKQAGRSTPLGKSWTCRGVFRFAVGWWWVNSGPRWAVAGRVSGIAKRVLRLGCRHSRPRPRRASVAFGSLHS